MQNSALPAVTTPADTPLLTELAARVVPGDRVTALMLLATAR